MSIESTPESLRPRIRELRLRRFRAFENARLILDDFTVIVGRNGSGKTTLMDAFAFIRDAVTDSVSTALERRGGGRPVIHRPTRRFLDADLTTDEAPRDEIEIGIDIQFPKINVLYGFTLGVAPRSASQVYREVLRSYPKRSFSFERKNRDFATSVRGVQPTIDPESLLLPLIAGAEAVWRETLDFLRNIRVYRFSAEAMQAEPPIGGQGALAKDGSNLGDVVYRLQHDANDMEWIVRHLETVTSGITRVEATSSGGRRTLDFRQATGSSHCHFNAFEMSAGTLHSLGVLVALRQRPVPSVVFVDEIESSVHATALAALMEAAALTAEERCQVLVSSHSPDALSHRAVTAENVRIVDWQDDRSFVFHVGEGARELLKPPETVGRLLQSNALWTEDKPKTVPGDIFEVPGNDQV